MKRQANRLFVHPPGHTPSASSRRRLRVTLSAICSFAMKTPFLSLFLIAAITAGAADQPAGRPTDAARRAVKSEPAAGPHHRVHTRVVERPGADGRIVREESSYTELATGLNVLGADGNYVPSNPEFEFVQGGVQAVRTAHHLKLPARMGGAFGVEIVTPDGQTVRCHPLAVAAFDPVSGKREFLAVVADAQGWLVDPQTVVYSNCFSGLRASIRIYNGRAGVASDLLLEEIPDLAALGMPEGRLELWTEWEETAPFAQKEIKVLHGEADPARRARMQAPDVTDQTMALGAMQLAPGKAFVGGARLRGLAPVADGLPVGKSTFMAEGRRFLVETVDHGRLIRLFGQANVPGPQQAAVGPAGRNVPARPARDARAGRRPGVIGPATERIQMAMASSPGAAKGRTLATLDWELLNTTYTDVTLKSDTTYLVSGFADFYGTTRIEGGTVVKYAGSNAATYLLIRGDLICDTSPWRMAVFTSANDRSVGEDLWTANTPTNYHVALGIAVDGTQLKHVRIAYADYGIHSAGSVTVSHSQFLHGTHGFLTENGTSTARNVLFYDMTNVFHGINFAAVGVNLTVDGCAALATDFYTPGNHSIQLTNCLMSRVASNGTESVTWDHTAWETNSLGVFETVGGGAHYLPAGSTNRDAGTTAIDTNLLAELRARTTDAPLWLSGAQTEDVLLAPRAALDWGNPDLGYHYAPLDYVAEDWVVKPGVTVLLTNGAVLGLSCNAASNYSCAVFLDDARLVSEGTATANNRVVSARVVQEAEGGFPISFGAMLSDGASLGLSSNAVSEVRLRFTELGRLAGDPFFLYTGAGYAALEWSHCDLGALLLGGDFSSAHSLVVGMTNCLLDRAYVTLTGGGQLNTAVNLQNNLVKSSSLSLDSADDPWQARDNVFDTTLIETGFSETLLARSNAMYATTFPAAWTNQIILTNLVYQTGPLGPNYLGGNAALVNQGSQLASLAGLYHFTTATNQVKETDSVVDLGIHYVALNAAGNPVDTDGDGIPDYLEDRDGSGDPASAALWQSEYNSRYGLDRSTLPYQIFTPLKAQP